ERRNRAESGSTIRSSLCFSALPFFCLAYEKSLAFNSFLFVFLILQSYQEIKIEERRSKAETQITIRSSLCFSALPFFYLAYKKPLRLQLFPPHIFQYYILSKNISNKSVVGNDDF